jgi:hypothetical protein
MKFGAARKLREQLHEPCEAEASVERLERYLGAASKQYGKTAMVSVAQVLDLVNPRGGWRFLSEGMEPEGGPAPAPDADPLTGCRPVTASGQ